MPVSVPRKDEQAEVIQIFNPYDREPLDIQGGKDVLTASYSLEKLNHHMGPSVQ